MTRVSLSSCICLRNTSLLSTHMPWKPARRSLPTLLNLQAGW
jgi:hypothetical protein